MLQRVVVGRIIEELNRQFRSGLANLSHIGSSPICKVFITDIHSKTMSLANREQVLFPGAYVLPLHVMRFWSEVNDI